MGLKMNSGVYVGTKGSVISFTSFDSRHDAILGNYDAPDKVSLSISNFFKKSTTNHFNDFKVSKNVDGTYTAIGDNPGKVTGSHAVYVKIINSNGKTISVYKTTYDNKNKFVHKKIKMGGKKPVMKYSVPLSKMEQYLNLEIDDNGLFPEEAPLGTSFYDLAPEDGNSCVVKVSHIINLLNTFIKGNIDDDRIKDYVEALIALDLFVFDDSSDYTHDILSNAIFSLDEIKDVNGLITIEDAQRLLNQLIS